MPEVKGLKTYRLGKLIELCDERNTEGKYTDFFGLNINKEFMPTVADTNGLDATKYKIVRKNRFVFSGMQTGRDGCIRLGMYEDENPILISPAYTTFEIENTDIVLPTYFYMIFCSKEKDRYGAFCSDGSIRTNLDLERFCDFELELPPLEVQKKYVAVYQGAKANLEAYQSRLSSLKLVCDGMIDKIKSQRICSAHTGFTEKEANGVAVSKSDGNKKDANGFVQPIRASQEKGANDVSRKQIRWQKLGDLIELCDERLGNSNKNYEVRGINITKEFMPTAANVDGNDLRNYKVVKQNQFAFSGMQTGRDNCIRIAIHKNEIPIIISPAYTVFQIKDEKILSDYLMLWLSRKEIDRYGAFASDGSIRSNLDLDRFLDFQIPLPSLEVQKDIVNIYKTYIERGRIASALKEQIKKMCPVLIRGSLEG